MKLEPNTPYTAWLAYRNHPDGTRGVPVSQRLTFQTEKPMEGHGIKWVGIGTVITDREGFVPFFKQEGSKFTLPDTT